MPPKTRKSSRSSRKTRRSQRRGGGASAATNTRSAATQAMKAFCEANRMSEQDFFLGVLNNDYYLKSNSKYPTKGLRNPCIVSGFVFRARGHRALQLEARPATAADTPEALDAMRDGAPGVTDNVYIDKANNAKYVVISQLSDI